MCENPCNSWISFGKQNTYLWHPSEMLESMRWYFYIKIHRKNAWYSNVPELEPFGMHANWIPDHRKRDWGTRHSNQMKKQCFSSSHGEKPCHKVRSPSSVSPKTLGVTWLQTHLIQRTRKSIQEIDSNTLRNLRITPKWIWQPWISWSYQVKQNPTQESSMQSIFGRHEEMSHDVSLRSPRCWNPCGNPHDCTRNGACPS